MRYVQSWVRWIGLAAAGLALVVGVALFTIRVRAQVGAAPTATGLRGSPQAGAVSCPMMLGTAGGGCAAGRGAPQPDREGSGDSATPRRCH